MLRCYHSGTITTVVKDWTILSQFYWEWTNRIVWRSRLFSYTPIILSISIADFIFWFTKAIAICFTPHGNNCYSMLQAGWNTYKQLYEWLMSKGNWYARLQSFSLQISTAIIEIRHTNMGPIYKTINHSIMIFAIEISWTITVLRYMVF